MNEKSPGKSISRPFPVRSVLWTMLVVGAVAGGIYLADRLVLAPRRQMEARLVEMDKENTRLKTYLKLLEHTERRAQLEVIAQKKDANGETVNQLCFTELDPRGGVVGTQRMVELRGEEVYVDTMVVKFEDHFVEQGDPLKGKALLLFRRIFTNRMKPDDGYVLDRNGVAPLIYATRSAPNDFERELWAKFWDMANNEALAKKAGVKAMHGQAAYGKLLPNVIYNLVMRSTGEIIIPPPQEFKADTTP